MGGSVVVAEELRSQAQQLTGWRIATAGEAVPVDRHPGDQNSAWKGLWTGSKSYSSPCAPGVVVGVCQRWLGVVESGALIRPGIEQARRVALRQGAPSSVGLL